MTPGVTAPASDGRGRARPVLTLGLVVLGLAALPAVALVTAADLNAGNAGEFLRLALPAIVGFPAVWFLRRLIRRSPTGAGAWLLAAVGVVTLLAVSAAPVVAVARVAHLQWEEYQPGGRGDVP